MAHHLTFLEVEGCALSLIYRYPLRTHIRRVQILQTHGSDSPSAPLC